MVEQLCKKYSKSAGQICLKWAIQQNVVVIPKSSRIKENDEIFDFRMSDEDMT